MTEGQQWLAKVLTDRARHAAHESDGMVVDPIARQYFSPALRGQTGDVPFGEVWCVARKLFPHSIQQMNFFIAGLALGIFVGALLVVFLTPRPPDTFE